MSPLRKIGTIGALLVLLLALVWGVVWRSPAPQVDEVEQARIERAMVRTVELKDSSLAALENRDFHAAEPSLLELATQGIGEPIGSRNWLINRIAIVGTIPPKDTSRVADAIESARNACNLEWNLDREGPVRYCLASKIEFLSQNFARQFEYLHNGAGRAQDYPPVWHDLYLAERDSRDDSVRADGENALKTLYDLVPHNLYVQLEWMGVQARRKDSTIVATLDRARRELLPFLDDVPAATPIAPARAIADASIAAKAADWAAVQRNVTVLDVVGGVQPAVRNDKHRVDRSLLWLIKTDFSDEFYRKHVFDRVLAKESVPVHFRDAALGSPLAGLSDVRDARLIDFDRDGRLDIALLRKSSLDLYAQASTAGGWTRRAALSLPADGYEHLLAADLDRNASPPKSDLVVFGPAGLLVVENRLEPGAKSPSLRKIESASLSEKTKGARSVVAVDLDHDGALDLVVACKPGSSSSPDSNAISVWRNLGGMQFADVTPRSGLVQTPSAAGSLVAVDWNHDFDMDVLLAGGGGPSPAGVRLLQGAGEGRFRLQPLATDNPAFQSATAIAVFDADANGSCDVLAAGPAGMALLRTSSTEPGEVNILGADALSDFPAEHLLVLDYDNDGCQDVIAWNGDAVRCFHGSGNGRFDAAAASELLPPGLNAFLSADCGDVDGDGDLDLVVVTPEAGGGRLHLLRNEGGNANNWIDVQLVGGPSGPPGDSRPSAAGTGSTLQLKSSVVCQSQVVTGPVTHFGIGKLESADVLRIVWPNGIPADIEQPAKNRIVRAGPPPRGWR